jgi:hypothetical protein
MSVRLRKYDQTDADLLTTRLDRLPEVRLPTVLSLRRRSSQSCVDHQASGTAACT